jgi:hypothetical protein
MNYKLQLKKCEQVLIFVTACAVLMGVLFCAFGFTRRETPRLIKTATTSETDLTTTTRTWTYALANFKDLPEEWDSYSIYFYFYKAAGDPNAGAVVAHIYVADNFCGVANVIDVNVQASNILLSHTPTSGASCTSDPNRTWGDAIVLVSGTDYWNAQYEIITGTDIIGRVRFDPYWGKKVGVIFTGVENCDSVTAIMVGGEKN